MQISPSGAPRAPAADLRSAISAHWAEEQQRRRQDPRLAHRPPPRSPLERDPHAATALQHVLDSSLQTLGARSMHATLKRIAGGLATLPHQSPEVRALRNDAVKCLEQVSLGTSS